MGRATAQTVSNNGKARIELERKKKMWDWDWWQKVQDFELNEYGNKPVQGGEGCANSVLHCCSDNNHNGQKSGAGFRNSIFAKHSGRLRPQLAARTPVGIWMGF